MSSTKIENRTENQPSSSSPNLKSPADSSEMLGQKEQTYMEWAQEKYNEQYDVWMPWIEDHFLKWFTTHNKASYATKDTLDKTKVTGVEQVDKLQDGVHDVVAGQFGQGGLLQPVGDLVSKEGINRAERKGKDENGSYIPSSLPSVPNPLSGLTGQK